MEHEMGESPEFHREALKQRELEILRQKIEDFESESERPFNPDNPEGPINLYTPLEHRLLGSTFKGCGYHPNLAIASVRGSSLETINKAREEFNQKVGPLIVYVKPEHAHAGQALALKAKLGPLTEEVMTNESPVETLEILGVTNIFDEPITEREKIDEALALMRERITEVQKQAIQELEKEEELPQAA